MRWTLPSFVVGANLPWLNYGGDFGANAWQPGGGVAQPSSRARLRHVLGEAASSGAALMRWFMLCDGRSGLVQDAAGRPQGLDPRVFADADAAVEELDRAGLRAIFVLVDFHWFRRSRVINGVQIGGRGCWLADAGLRLRTFERIVAPLLDRYGRASAVAAWDIINEPEWVTRQGGPASWMLPVLDGRVAGAGVSRAAMRAFIGEACALVHQRTTQAVTVGSASAAGLPLVQGLGLDVYQVHWYDRHDLRLPLDRPVTELGLDRPVLLGEFPTRGCARTPAEIMATAARAGYAGALGWAVTLDDEVSDRAALGRGMACSVEGRQEPT